MREWVGAARRDAWLGGWDAVCQPESGAADFQRAVPCVTRDARAGESRVDRTHGSGANAARTGGRLPTPSTRDSRDETPGRRRCPRRRCWANWPARRRESFKKITKKKPCTSPHFYYVNHGAVQRGPRWARAGREGLRRGPPSPSILLNISFVVSSRSLSLLFLSLSPLVSFSGRRQAHRHSSADSTHTAPVPPPPLEISEPTKERGQEVVWK